MTPPSRRWGRWPELSTGHKIAFALIFAQIAWIAVAVLRGPQVTVPTGVVTLTAAPGSAEVTPESLEAASRIVSDRATELGTGVVVIRIRGSRLEVDAGRPLFPDEVSALAAPGRIRVYAASQVEIGVPLPSAPPPDFHTLSSPPFATRGAPIATSDTLTVRRPGPRDPDGTLAVLTPTGPDRAAVRRRIGRTTLAIVIDDTLITSHLDASGDRPPTGIRLGAELIPDPYRGLRAVLMHGPLPVTLTPRP